MSVCVMLLLYFVLATLGEGAVRLVNGRVEGEGRVEIFHRMEWGSICDIFFDDVDAQVICRYVVLTMFAHNKYHAFYIYV